MGPALFPPFAPPRYWYPSFNKSAPSWSVTVTRWFVTPAGTSKTRNSEWDPPPPPAVNPNLRAFASVELTRTESVQVSPSFHFG